MAADFKAGVMADDNTGYSVSGESLKRIGRVVRAVETNQPIPLEEKRRSRFNGRMVEGVFLEDLPGTDDPDDPAYARFQIKTSLVGTTGWANQNSPSIIPVWNRSPSSAAEGDFGFAAELYPNKWFWVAGGGGGSGAKTIRFRIVASYFCGQCYVMARVISVDGGTSPASLPGIDSESYDGQYFVRVYDKKGCHFDWPEEDLLNLIGSATWRDSLEDGPCPDTTGNHWEVDSLCCPGEAS